MNLPLNAWQVLLAAVALDRLAGLLRGCLDDLSPARPVTTTEYTENTECSGMGLLFEKETYRIRGAIFAVYREMGPGLLENVYQECLVL